MTPTLKGDLTPDQKSTLAECERVIDAGILSFVEVGNALLKISDERLYRQTHDTFAAYVNDRYKMSASRAYQLCEAAEVVKEIKISTNGGQIPVANERQARELAKAPKGKRAEVLQKAAETSGGKPTAKDIEAEVTKITEPKRPTIDNQWREALGKKETAKSEALQIALADLEFVISEAKGNLNQEERAAGKGTLLQIASTGTNSNSGGSNTNSNSGSGSTNVVLTNTVLTNFFSWVDDALPAGAVAGADGGDSWNWVNSNPTPYSGQLASQSAIASGEHQHFFSSATTTMSVNAGDTLVTYIYIDPANLPSEIMLQWNDGNNWEHRAYWGSNSITFGAGGTTNHCYMGSLPAAGNWVPLYVPAASVGLAGSTVSGMAFSLYNGRATWDAAGKAELLKLAETI